MKRRLWKCKVIVFAIVVKRILCGRIRYRHDQFQQSAITCNSYCPDKVDAQITKALSLQLSVHAHLFHFNTLSLSCLHYTHLCPLPVTSQQCLPSRSRRSIRTAKHHLSLHLLLRMAVRRLQPNQPNLPVLLNQLLHQPATKESVVMEKMTTMKKKTAALHQDPEDPRNQNSRPRLEGK